jgi:hypothetical protein
MTNQQPAEQLTDAPAEQQTDVLAEQKSGVPVPLQPGVPAPQQQVVPALQQLGVPAQHQQLGAGTNAAAAMTESGHTFFVAFGASLAITLLLLWVATVLWFVVIAFADDGCNVGVSVSNATSDRYQCPTSAFVQVHNVTFGLVSAAVVAHLANATPGRSPSRRLTMEMDVNDKLNICCTEFTSALYVTSWGVFGLLALIVGSLSNNAVVLRSTGFSFLGNAIAATYAYFGIDPSKDAVAQV